MSGSSFRLNPALDAASLRARFERDGRLHVPDFLVEDDAGRLYGELRHSEAWRLIVNHGDTLFELDRAAQAALSAQAQADLTKAVHAAARYGFQYLYEAIRVPDTEHERAVNPTELNRFASFMSSPPVIALLRQITGRDEIDFADAQATAYGLGHFLTAHDDEVQGKKRHAAYVFNLTPRWSLDWGGLLAFHGADGHVEQAYKPCFNALNLFTVPQPHSVTIVAPFAASRRYSVTGWLRSRGDEDDHV